MNLLDRDRLGVLLARAGTTRIVAGGLAIGLAVLAVVGLTTIDGGAGDAEQAGRTTSTTLAPEAGSDDAATTDSAVALDVTIESSVSDAAGAPAASDAESATASASGSSRPAAASTAIPAASAAAPTTTAARPLAITEFGWAQSSTSQNGWVPPEGLPVAVRGGDIDRMSFFRLGGRGTVLKLGVLSRDSGPLNEGPAVVACPITSDAWKAAPRQALSRAPQYEASNCVNGKRFDSTTVTFDLSRFPERIGGRGFVIVPKGPVGATFEIVFSNAERA